LSPPETGCKWTHGWHLLLAEHARESVSPRAGVLLSNSSPARRRLGLVAKAAVVVALLWLLAHEGLISWQATRRAFARYDRMIPAIAALVAAVLLAGIRWQWLLRAHDIRLKLGRTFQLTLIGNFFSLALPGAVSGDLVKAFYVAKEAPGRRRDAFASIVFDRIVGLSALVLVSAVALLLEPRTGIATAGGGAIRLFVGSAAVVAVLFYAYLFLVPGPRQTPRRLLEALERRAPRTASIHRIYVSLRHYHDRRRTVFQALMVSVLIHLLVCFACLNFWRALQPAGGSSLGPFVVVPIGLLVTAVPIAPAGVGTGHAAFGWLFLHLGSRAGANVFSLFVLVQLALAGVGGLIYLGFRSTAEEPDPVAADPNLR
jgi:hypothetical protein